jgi:transcriptional regulator with XRE-family HTH domain
MLFAKLVHDKMQSEGLTIREGARALGMSASTITRLLNGFPMDLETMIKVCNWLGVSPASVLNSQAIEGTDKLAASIAMILEREPTLASIFREALEDVEKGKLSPEDVQEIVSYAAYRINQRKSKPT